MLPTAQILCPHCNGSQPPSESPHYRCLYCLSHFTTSHAHIEYQRLEELTKQWLSQSMQSLLNQPQVDTSVRGRIFRKEILPLLKREVERAVEPFQSSSDLPLLFTPVSEMRINPSRHPYLQMRQRILDLKILQARLEDKEIGSYATSAEDRTSLRIMEHQLTRLISLSNATFASVEHRNQLGYQAARDNFIKLAGHASETLELLNAPEQRRLWTLFLQAYQCLAGYAGLCHQLGQVSAAGCGALCSNLIKVQTSFSHIAEQLDLSSDGTSQAMELSLCLQREVEETRWLMTWLESFGLLANETAMNFITFIQRMEPFWAREPWRVEQAPENVRLVLNWALRVRGRQVSSYYAEFDWVFHWSESHRKRARWGLFGSSETVDGTTLGMVPVWLIRIRYSSAEANLLGVKGREDESQVLIGAWTRLMPVVAKPSSRELFLNLRTGKVPNKYQVAFPVCSAADAEIRAMQYIATQTERFTGGSLLASPELVFLPCAQIVFRHRDTTRKVFATHGGSYWQSTDDLNFEDAGKLLQILT